MQPTPIAFDGGGIRDLPQTHDEAIEREIVAKGKTAPRVMPAAIEANIEAENYFTATDGIVGANSRVDAKVMKHSHESHNLLTFCVLVLRNGFTVIGTSACASPENFDAELGRKYAREDALRQVSLFMGHALKQRLHERAEKGR